MCGDMAQAAASFAPDAGQCANQKTIAREITLWSLCNALL
jgi:hypothetical protein